jgi:nitrogen regulatory protein PII-like uncharacterized protein
MSDLFKDILPSILVTKENVVENEKDYVPYVINRSLSLHYDCIFHANQMNMLPNVDGILQYHYYLNTIRAWKRPFQKWQRLEKDEDLEVVKEFYNYSTDKAKAALQVLDGNQLTIMKKSLNKGGINDRYLSGTRSTD